MALFAFHHLSFESFALCERPRITMNSDWRHTNGDRNGLFTIQKMFHQQISISPRRAMSKNRCSQAYIFSTQYVHVYSRPYATLFDYLMERRLCIFLWLWIRISSDLDQTFKKNSFVRWFFCEKSNRKKKKSRNRYSRSSRRHDALQCASERSIAALAKTYSWRLKFMNINRCPKCFHVTHM